MKDTDIIEIVNNILKKIDDFFHSIEPSLSNAISRDKYFEIHPEITDHINYNFSLSADDIIKNKIPYNVAGCTGRAKLFSKFAQEAGLKDFSVVTTVKTDQIGYKGNGLIPGHQLIGIKLSSGMVLIDPGKGKTFEKATIKAKCYVDENIDALGNNKNDYTITAILSPNKYDEIDSYDKMKKVYYNCNTAKKILFNYGKRNINNKKYENIKKQLIKQNSLENL